MLDGVFLAGMAVLLACRPDDPVGDPSRRHAGELDELYAVVGGLQDSVLLHPRFPRVGDRGLVLYDQGRNAIEAFDRAGQLLWVFGKRGRGPGEFLRVTDLRLHQSGSIWILDLDNARLTILSPAGSYLRSLPIPRDAGLADRFYFLDARRIVLLAHRDPIAAVMDTSGQLLGFRQHPWPEARNHHPMALAFKPLLDPDDDRLVLMQYYGAGLLATDRGLQTPARLIPYVEPIPIPDVHVARSASRTVATIQTRTLAAVDGVRDGDDVYILFGGLTDGSRRFVDHYDLETGRYLDTWLLPSPARYIAVAGDTLFSVHMDPLPRLQAWRLRRDPG
ncbi:MAG TPA: hypothetical protein VF192_12865 [Longimicrobiales bacterium]